MGKKLICNPDFIRKHLTFLFENKPDDLYFAICTSRPSQDGLKSRYFREIDPAVKYAAGLSHQNVYVSNYLSHKDYGPKHRCTIDPEIRPVAGIVCLWADLDYGKNGHANKKNYPPTLDTALELITGNGLDFSAIIHSGHGIYPLILFKDPWIFSDDDERQRAATLVRRYEQYIRDCIRDYDLDSTSDLTRVLRIAGTVNNKSDPILAEILVLPGNQNRYNPDDDIFSFILPPDPKPGTISVKNNEIKEFNDEPLPGYDQTLLQKAFESKNGDKIQRLYKGDWKAHSSRSQADQALCDHLAFWFGKNPERMDSVFRTSKLYRKKWDEKHYADGRTYGEETINNAIDFTTEIFNGKPGKAANPTIIDETALNKRVQEILDSQKPCGTLDTSKLPSILEDYIQSICLETQAEPIIIAQSVLCCASAMLGRRICMPEYFQPLYPNLWTLTISPSGSFKTTALNKGSMIALKRQNQILIEIDNLQLKIAELQLDRLGLKINEKEIKEKEIKKLEKLVNELSKNNPVLPNRSTAEGLMVLLGDSSGGIEHPGGMVISSEFGEWVQNFDRSHNLGYKPLLTDLYDVPEVWKYFTKVGGCLIIRKPFITINAVSTLPWVEKNITPDDVSSGFFARFLIFYPPQATVIPPALPTKYRSRDQRAENEIKNILNGKIEKKYTLSPSARELFENIHLQLYRIMGEQPNKTQEILGPYLKRWSPDILKIAMLLQVLDDPETDKIWEKAILGATSVVDYAINSTIYLFKNELGESEQQRKQRKILEYIANRKGKVKRSQLVGSRVLDGGAKDYDYVLESLEAAGQIEVDTSTGNKTEWIYVLTHEKG